MKKGFLLLTLIGGLAYITLSSNSTGYTIANLTGSDGAGSPGCGGTGCHGTSATAAIVDSFVLDSAGLGTIVTKYTPGKNYMIRFFAVNTSTSNLPYFGLQMSVVKASGGASGGLISPITNTDTFGTSIRVLVQTARLSPASGTGGIGTVYSVAIPWTAPAAGTGAIKVYGVINCVNNDSMASGSDKWNTKNTTFQERTSSSVPQVSKAMEVSAFPNPVLADLSLQLNNAPTGTYTVVVYDLTGKLMNSQAVEVSGNTNATISMQNCVPGIYHVVVGKDGANSVLSVVKQ